MNDVCRKYWGLSSSIDLKECCKEKITNGDYIKKFSVKLCDEIEMKRFGEPIVIKFGEDKRVSGYSLVQLIETSSITAHFVDQDGSAYIDIFSCKYYDTAKAMRFCKEAFDAKESKINSNFRY